MPATQQNISTNTPLGANLVSNGCTFRVRAPRATQVHVLGDFNGWKLADASLLTKDAKGFWSGFMPGATEGQTYKFWIVRTEGDRGP